MKNLNFENVSSKSNSSIVKKEYSFEKIEGFEDLPVSIFETLRDWDIYTIIEDGKVVGKEAYAYNTITALRKLKVGNLLLANAMGKI